MRWDGFGLAMGLIGTILLLLGSAFTPIAIISLILSFAGFSIDMIQQNKKQFGDDIGTRLSIVVIVALICVTVAYILSTMSENTYVTLIQMIIAIISSALAGYFWKRD